VLRRAPEGFVPTPWEGRRGVYLPTEFTVLFPAAIEIRERSDGARAEARLVQHEINLSFSAPGLDGEPALLERVEVRHSGGDITPSNFRVPLATYRRYALAAAAGTQAEISGGGSTAETSIREARERKTFAELAMRPVGRPRLEDSVDLAAVARVAAQGHPTPTKAVQQQWTVSKSAARRWIRRAEAQGHSTQPAPLAS
jgi:hypothetical protein